MFGRIIRGCGYLEGYGHHPGTGLVLGFVVATTLTGLAEALDAGQSWLAGSLVGGLFSLPIVGLYLYGAYDRAALYDRKQARRTDNE